MDEVLITTVTTLNNPKRQKSVGMYLIELKENGEIKTRQGYLKREDATSQELTIQLLANAMHIVNRLNRDFSYVEMAADEQRVVNAIENKWLNEWEANGWKTSKGKEVANADCWKILKSEIADTEIRITKESSYTHYLTYQAEKMLEKEKTNEEKT